MNLDERQFQRKLAMLRDTEHAHDYANLWFADDIEQLRTDLAASQRENEQLRTRVESMKQLAQKALDNLAHSETRSTSTIADYERMGCVDYTDRLGIQKMPHGYALLLDPDGAYFSWVHLASEAESAIHWNKWAVWRGAWEHSRRQSK